MDIKTMQKEAYRISAEHGFHDNDEKVSFGERIALIHSEASEALEEHRVGRMGDWYSGLKPEGVGAELADIIIRVGDMCETYGIDLEAKVVEKMKYNETRPYKHGKNY